MARLKGDRLGTAAEKRLANETMAWTVACGLAILGIVMHREMQKPAEAVDSTAKTEQVGGGVMPRWADGPEPDGLDYAVAVVIVAFVVAITVVALTGCATHTQPDTRMWDETRDMIRDGSFTDDATPMPQWLSNPPRTPGAIDVTGTPIWDAENGVWRQGGPCVDQPIRHADDTGVWG